MPTPRDVATCLEIRNCENFPPIENSTLAYRVQREIRTKIRLSVAVALMYFVIK